jgi:diguanylate cyclase (GGDEF)-like protein
MFIMMLADNWTMSSTVTLLLAVVATLGYLLGRRRPEPPSRARRNTRHEIMRALAVAQELETIAYRLRKSMAAHVPAIVRFNGQLKRWESSDVTRHELCDRADELLKPALRLSTEISHAYADLLQQMTHLSTFAELRTDPLTGVHNRRAFDESLENLLAAQADGELPLSVAMLDLDQFKNINDAQGHLAGDRVLQDLAQLIKAGLREGDVLGRFGGEEFVVLMPHTPLRTACNLAERMRARVEDNLPTTISIGVAATMPAETATSLLSRADAALYSAKKEGRNRVCLQEGGSGRLVTIRKSSDKASDQKPPTAGNVPVAVLSAGDTPAAGLCHGETC